MEEQSDPSIYAIIGNIPPIYHSCDLRNFFSQFLETGGFQCFHFRHRPEEKRIKSQNEQDKNTTTQTTNEVSGTFKVPYPVPSISSKTDPCDSRKKTLCCLIRLKQTFLRRLLEMYHRKHWLDKNGASMPGLCMIAKIKIAEDEECSASKYKTRGELRKIPQNRETFTRFDLLSIAELHPPDVMPQGNVGTPTKHFLDLIAKCKLAPNIIKRLGLTFPKTRGRRIYASVDFNYGGEVVNIEKEDEIVKSAGGKELYREGDRIEPSTSDNRNPRAENNTNEDGDEEAVSDEDDDGCEDWERHESLTDDPANIERNKERLYEEEMEVTWEKGGSGIVWYTDATFWKEKEGDFDEQTSDDWDVDTSVYYESMGGDKDARDYVQLRLHQRRRDGLEDTDRFSCGIGKFEKHTRGVGRKVMESQGWTDGQSLGSSVEGIVDALSGDGQTAYDKRGLGYQGESVNRYNLSKKPRKEGEFFVSTMYDDPLDTDPKDTLLRRKNPNKVTFRGSGMEFVKGNVQDFKPS